MKRFNKYFAPLLSTLIAASLSSCASPPTNPKADNAGEIFTNISSTTQLAPAPLTSASPQRANKALVASQSMNIADSQTTSTPTSKNTVTVSIYQPDSQCQTLKSEKVAVPAQRPMEAAVGKVLEQQDTGDFSVAGYRLSVNPKNGIATVDMRLLPNSKRKFVSLSTCEQFALFGSLRKTLTSNQTWKIKDVRFTEQSQEIYL
ncbi:MAG TPA: hypothetical protein V6D12_07900 [Candidatus Obscuribacterales bacterium]